MSAEHISEIPPPPRVRRRFRKEKALSSDALANGSAKAPANIVSKTLAFRSEESFEESVSETKRHLEARTTLYLVLRKAYEVAAKRHRQWKKAAIGSEQFVYYDSQDPQKCFSPDVFVKVDSNARDFNTWKVWERGTPDLVVEIVSESDRDENAWRDKITRYQASGVREIVRFDADAQEPIAVWDRVGNLFVERKRSGVALLECKTLGLYWVAVRDETYGPQLRLAKDRTGKQILPTPGESEMRLEQELAEERRARAQAEHERLLAEQRHQEETATRLVAEQRLLLAEQRQQEEAHARLLAEQRQQEEAHARLLAEQRQQEEAHARLLAEQKQIIAEQKRQEESEARERVEAEAARLREEVEQLRKAMR